MTISMSNDNLLFIDIKQLIDKGKHEMAMAVNVKLTTTYWHIGKRINDVILQNKRAEYGKGWSSKHLRHCLRFAETFPEFEIVSTLWRQLSWSHFKAIIYLDVD